MITKFYGEDRNPVFAPDEQSIYFLSEESGTFNVHQLSLANPTERKQITDFKLHPVRSLSIAQNGMMSFSYDGELYTAKAGEAPQKLAVTLHCTQDIKNKDSFISINGGIREMDISPDGKEVVVIARGRGFCHFYYVDGSITKRITTTAEQERFV